MNIWLQQWMYFKKGLSLDADKKANKTSEAAPAAAEKVDFSNVKIEPIFEEMVDFDTFSKSDFRAVKILACEAVPKSKKLLKFTLDDGERKDRVILSGIHDYYKPEELVGKTAIAIVNLPPRKMMGIDSEMQEVQQVLFNYITDNAEEFSSEISTIEDKQKLLKLKKILIAARDCCNLVRTFGDDELKETFAKMELTKLPSLISEVQHHIDNINQKELFASDDTTKLLVNEAMEDITFNFSKISEEELKIVGGKDAVTEKYKKTVRVFIQNIDPDDPEFITLQEAFLLRFKQQGFEPKSVSEIEEQGKELEDILKKLDELQKKNTVLLRKYNGDAKFARVHKRIREENLARKAANKQPIVSEYDMSIMNVLLTKGIR